MTKLARNQRGLRTIRLWTGWDLGLLFVLLIVGLILFQGWHRPTQAETAIIKFANGQIQEVNLDQNQTVIIEGRVSPMTIQVRQGQLTVEESGCPEQICVESGELPQDTPVIICVPNGVLIETGRRAGYDALTW